MILFDLKCPKDHVFEAWFRDGDAFESQIEAKSVCCPVCGSRKIAKAPMAPRIGKGEPIGTSSPPRQPATMRHALRQLRQQIEENCDYVGERFPEEARRIHYGEVEKRDIYGEASDEDAQALDDEGIEVRRIPWVPRHDN